LELQVAFHLLFPLGLFIVIFVLKLSSVLITQLDKGGQTSQFRTQSSPLRIGFSHATRSSAWNCTQNPSSVALSH